MTVKSSIIGIRDKRKQKNEPKIEQIETFLKTLNKVKKMISPKRNIIGEINKVYPAKQATAFPPLK